MWILTVTLNEGTHYHVNISNPAQAAELVTHLNKASEGRFECRLVFLDPGWSCDREGCFGGSSTESSFGRSANFS